MFIHPDTTTLPVVGGRLWEIVYRTVDQLSPTQAAVIGGAGSTASTASVLSVDGATWLQYFTIACGVVGGVLSVALVVLKFVQQRREMCAWEEKMREQK